MSATVVIGGQYGSEGKGKVAHFFAAEQSAAAVVRIGGPNSGHTTMSPDGGRHVLRQLPTAALLDDVTCVIGPGSYVDPEVLEDEIARLDLSPERICVDYRAMVVTAEDRAQERGGDLGPRIGSTCSGTGAAVQRRIRRRSQDDLAVAHPDLRPYVGDAVSLLRELAEDGRRVVIEGAQGLGLSLLHSPHFPYVTSRDTSAAGALSEAGLSPLDVDTVVLVIRSFPIRVAGTSGPFDAEEVDWETVGREAGLAEALRELSSVTGRVRRVARFDPGIVRRAMQVNRPSSIVLNHLDYVDGECATGRITERALSFIRQVEHDIGCPVDLAGVGPYPGDLIRVEHEIRISA